MNVPHVAVVGHVEWVTHARGDLPAHGQISHLTDPIEEPAGGGAISACQVANLGARCSFFTALGDDWAGRAARQRLEDGGCRVEAAIRPQGQTRALSATGPGGERSIAVIGPALAAAIDDPLPWVQFESCHGVYFTGHDPAVLRAARAAPLLVVTARRLDVLIASGVRADVLVGSASDRAEQIDAACLPDVAAATVVTEGARGGRWRCEDGTGGRWSAVDPPGPVVDSYGCGDAFVAGLTVALARGDDLAAAANLGARCGATTLTGRGGLSGQLRLTGSEWLSA